MRRAFAIAIALALFAPASAGAFGPEVDAGAPETSVPITDVRVLPPVDPPSPPVLPPDVYLVREVYAGDAVLVEGPLTIYRTLTVLDTPGTYARLLQVVRAGEASAYDGLAFNGRAVHRDGRAVAGAYYETLVLVAGALVHVSIVFFQDDSRLDQGDVDPGPGPVAATAGDIEVLRGRAIALTVPADPSGPLRAWRVVGGDHVLLGPSSGGPADPIRLRWDRVTSPGAATSLAIQLETEVERRILVSVRTIAVVVRSPALLR